MRNILIYPGTFDPVHRGHLNVMADAWCTGHFNHAMFLLQTNRFKESTMFTQEKRYEMLLKYSQQLNNDKITVEETSLSYLYEYILNSVSLRAWNIFILIGDDTLSNLSQWYKFNELASIVKFVVHRRKKTKTEINRQLKVLNIDGIILDSKPSLISSTDIRMDISRMIDKYNADSIEHPIF